MRSKGQGKENEFLSGMLLLAHPILREPTFRRTAILLANHDAEGALGVVINRPTGKTLGGLGQEFDFGELASVPVFMGGPVSVQQVLLCAWKIREDGNGFELHFGLEPHRAVEMLTQEGMHLRAFLGYSGWSGGQLEGELERDTWVVSPLPSDLMEHNPDELLWRNVLVSVDPSWQILADEPDDPTQN